MEILSDFRTSVEKALSEIDPAWEQYPGLIVCGTHTPKNVQEILDRIREARETNLPFLGICFGHQLAAIEYARNVLGQEGATSQEFDREGVWIVVKIIEGLKIGLHDGETWWNYYEVIPKFLEIWKKEENFVTCQFHPEYQSSKDKPHPLLVKFLDYAKKATQ